MLTFKAKVVRSQRGGRERREHTAHTLLASLLCLCVCVCVRERERERERQTDRQTPIHKMV